MGNNCKLKVILCEYLQHLSTYIPIFMQNRQVKFYIIKVVENLMTGSGFVVAACVDSVTAIFFKKLRSRRRSPLPRLSAMSASPFGQLLLA